MEYGVLPGCVITSEHWTPCLMIQVHIMSEYQTAIAHVVRSASKSNEFVQKRDQQKIYPTHMYFKGQYSLKLFTMGFLDFLDFKVD